MRIAYVVGARPNFVKVAPVIDTGWLGELVA
jgi:UDP-N-acetylglucosamine 2-epimerase